MGSNSEKSKTGHVSEELSDAPAKREYHKPALSRMPYREPVLSRLPMDETEAGILPGPEILILLS